MANTVAQNRAQVSYNNTTSVSAAYSSSCTSGSLLIAGLTADGNAAATLGASDPTNGAYTSAVSVSSTATKAEIFYFNNQTGTTALTVTGTSSVANYGVLKIIEVTGQATSSLIGQTGTYNTNNALATITLTSVAANSTIFAIDASYPGYNEVPVNDSGYTLGGGPTGLNNAYHTSEFIADAGASGNKTLNWNNEDGNRTGTPSFVAAEFKTAAGGAGDERRTPRLALLGVN